MLKDLDYLFNFLKKNNLTFKEFITCYLLYLQDDKLLYKFLTIDKGLEKGSFDKLLKEKWVKKSKYPSNILEENYVVDEKFKKELLRTIEGANKIWDLYPSFMYINGKTIPTKTMDKEDFIELFVDKNIGREQTLNDIIKAIEIVKDNEINLSIEKFIKSEQWKTINNDYYEY